MTIVVSAALSLLGAIAGLGLPRMRVELHPTAMSTGPVR